jgi:haloalkane dehalogenase
MINEKPNTTPAAPDDGPDRAARVAALGSRGVSGERRKFLAAAAALTGGALVGSTLDLGSPTAAAAAAKAPKVVRTPDERFVALPDYPFEPNYVRVDLGDDSGARLRMHYIDERPSDPAKASGETVLLLHGNPTWSYLYRHVIPPLVVAGHRCVALDLVGFGKSDKVADRFAYTYQRHVDWLSEAVFDRLNLRDVTMVCHDWGGLLGMLLLAQHPDRFRRVIVSNTTGPREGGPDLGPGWEYLAKWLQFTQRTEQLEPGQVVEDFTLTDLDPAVRAAYNAPFADDVSLHGVRRFAVLIPITAYDEANPVIQKAWDMLETLQIPFLCAFSDQDHVTHGDSTVLTARIAGARGTVIHDAAHFLQEDKPSEFAAVVNDFISSTS